MPRQLQIVEGPSFRGLLIENGIVGTTQWSLRFTMDRDIPSGFCTTEKDLKLFSLRVTSVGNAFRPKPEKENSDFTFVAEHTGHTPKVKGDPQRWFYFGMYNVKDRKGYCHEFSANELRARRGQKEMAKIIAGFLLNY